MPLVKARANQLEKDVKLLEPRGLWAIFSLSCQQRYYVSGVMVLTAENDRTSALPKAWIVPIRLGIYSLLAACSAYVYFHLDELEFTHYLVIMSVVAVLAMALLDCRVSDEYWRKQEAQEKSGKSR